MARGDHSQSAALSSVRKRDGREVPFDRSKIAAAVSRAMDAVEDSEPGFAAEVAGVVELALAEQHGAAGNGASANAEPPTIEAIQDLVEKALIDMGRVRVAKAYILYRDRRARIRGALQVSRRHLLSSRPDAAGAGADAADRVRVRDTRGTSGWSKGRIVAVLMNEAELPRSVADDVAAGVEARVFDSGLTRISTALVRELVDLELVSRGLTAALSRHEPVTLPRHDMRRLYAGEELHDWEERARWSGQEDLMGYELAPWPANAGGQAESRLAGELQARFALGEVLPDALAEMHLCGDLHVEDLGRVQQPLMISAPCELFTRGVPTAGSAFELLSELAGIASSTAYGVVLEDPGSVLQPLARGTRSKSPLGLSAWLRSLASVARAAGRRIDLGAPGERYTGFLPRLVEELAELPDEHFSPRLYLDGADALELAAAGEAVELALAALLRSGRLVITWGSETESFAAPGCRRLEKEQGALACEAAVAVNLPRLARSAGPFREERMFESLSSSVHCALAACRSILEFRRRFPQSVYANTRTRSSFAIVPIGLRESLRVLGDGEIDVDQGARLLGFLAEATRRFSTELGLSAVASPFFGQRAARRFAALDAARRVDPDQGELFSGEGPMREVPYAGGLRLSPLAGLAAGMPELRLSRTLISGALWPFPSTDGLAGEGPATVLRPMSAEASPSTWRNTRPTSLLERWVAERSRLESNSNADVLFPKSATNSPSSPTGAEGNPTPTRKSQVSATSAENPPAASGPE